MHEIASIAYGGALAACLVIDGLDHGADAAGFIAARHAFAAIARYVLIPSMAVVVVSGLISLAATRAYREAGWAWVKALLGLSTFEATLLVVGASGKPLESLTAVSQQAALDALLHAERNTLGLLIALSGVNVVLAVWRPKLTWTVR